MSRTAHHNAPKRPKLLTLADKYTGWTGDGCWAQEGRAFIKRLQRRHNRHYQNACARAGVNEDTSTIPLPFESVRDTRPVVVVVSQPKLKLPAVRWKRCSSTGLRPNFRSV